MKPESNCIVSLLPVLIEFRLVDWFMEKHFFPLLFFKPWLSQNLLYRLGWPQTQRDPPTSASQELELKAWTTTTTCSFFVIFLLAAGLLLTDLVTLTGCAAAFLVCPVNSFNGVL